MLISEHPPLSKELSAPSVAYREVTTVACTVFSCGKLFFGRDPEKVTRAHRTNPNCPPMVLDFLVSNAPREMVNLDAVARYRSPNAAHAVFALALQTAMMAAQATRYSEERSSTARLQADLEAARKQNAELADKLVAMERNSMEATKKAGQDAERDRVVADRMRAELIEARRSGEIALKEAVDREQAANHKAAAAEGKAEWATEELTAKVVKLDRVTRKLADLTKKIEAAKLDPYSNVEQDGKFAYCCCPKYCSEPIAGSGYGWIINKIRKHVQG
ncbi:hypothetical protein OROHE_004717 [Orobanche hederae]